MATDVELLAKLDAVDTNLVTLRDEIARENIKRDKRIRLSRILLVGVALLAALGIWYGVTGQRERNTAEKDRAARSYGSCVQYNVDQDEDIAAQDAHDRTLSDLLSPPPRDEATQARVDSALAILHQSSVAANNYRTCTPEGIAEFLGNPPPDPATSVPTTVICDTGDGIATTDEESADQIGC